MTLREYHRFTGANNQTISVGDVVIDHNDGPRVNWRLAVVTRLLIGHDGFMHAAEIQTSTGCTNRPISKLYPLEVHSDEYVNKAPPIPTRVTDDTLTVRHPERENRVDRPMRQSAKRSTEQMSEWVEAL